MPSQRDVADHLKLDTRTVRSLRDSGVLPDLRTVTLDQIRERYIGHLREVAAGRMSQDGSLDLAEERAKLARRQTEKAELDLAVRRGELVEASEVETVVVRLASGVVERMRAVPVKVAQEVHAAASLAAAERILQAAIDMALAEIAEYAEAVDSGPEPDGQADSGDSVPDAPAAA